MKLGGLLDIDTNFKKTWIFSQTTEDVLKPHIEIIFRKKTLSFLEKVKMGKTPDIETIFETDRLARVRARALMKG